MTHRIERVHAGAHDAYATINRAAQKMRAERVGSTADVVWMDSRIAELEVVRTSVGPVIAARNVWPAVGPWALADRVGLTSSQADAARREISTR